MSAYKKDRTNIIIDPPSITPELLRRSNQVTKTANRYYEETLLVNPESQEEDLGI